MRVLVYHPDQSDQYGQLVQSALPDVEVDVCATADQVECVIDDAEVLFASVTFPVEYLGAASKLRWIQVMGAGVERFTLADVVPPEVRLTRVSGVFGARISEYVCAQILSIGQDLPRVFRQQEERHWGRFVPQLIAGKVAGVAGFGNVGRSVGNKLAAVDLRVHSCDLRPPDDDFVSAHYTPDKLAEFLAELDFLILCLPLTSNTRNMIGTDEFAVMKESAYLINVARAGLVDQQSFVQAVKQGQIAGAVLDVFWEEPLAADSELWELPNVTITPHLAGPSVPEEITEVFLENFKRYKQGINLLNEVDLELGF